MLVGIDNPVEIIEAVFAEHTDDDSPIIDGPR